MIGDLTVWLLVCGLIAGIVIAAWQVIVFLAVTAIGLWALSKAAEAVGDGLERSRRNKAAIIGRADRQHHLIMSGDDEGGTYGDYLPPHNLR